MPQSLPNTFATTPANSVVRSCQHGARACMQTTLDATETPRKAIAQEVLGRDDEPQFSKMVGGTRPFDLDALDKLPRPVIVAWLQRYGQQLGVKVTDMEPGEITEQLLALVDQLATVAKLAKVVGRPVKAGLR